jgi:HSP20 family protein
MNELTPRLDRLEDFFPAFFNRFGRPFDKSFATVGDISLDITESDREYKVRAAIPGAKKDDIRVSVDGNLVSIRAEVRKDKEEKEGDRVVLKESSYGSAERVFSLAHDIDSSGVVAKLDDGVLKLTLPKRGGTTARAIAIQ